VDQDRDVYRMVMVRFLHDVAGLSREWHGDQQNGVKSKHLIFESSSERGAESEEKTGVSLLS
jgi:hypothetical protein